MLTFAFLRACVRSGSDTGRALQGVTAAAAVLNADAASSATALCPSCATVLRSAREKSFVEEN